MTEPLPLVQTIARLSAADARILASALVEASHHPRISDKGGTALAELADALILRGRTQARGTR